MPDPMDKFKPQRWNTQEKLVEIDKMHEEIVARERAERKAAAEREAAERAAQNQGQGIATGVFDMILSFGTRRCKGVVVDGRSPVGSSCGSIFGVLEGDGVNNENNRD